MLRAGALLLLTVLISSAGAQPTVLEGFAPDALERMGDDFYRKGQFHRAMPFYLEAVEKEPGRVVSLLAIGKILDGGFEREESLGYFRKALAIEPANPEVLFHCANAVAARSEQIALLEQYAAANIKNRPEWERQTALGRLALLKALGDKPLAQPAGARRAYELKLLPTSNYARNPLGRSATEFAPAVAVSAPGGTALKFLVGTATDGLWLTERAAKKLGAKILSPTRLHTLGRSTPEKGQVALLDSLRVGGLELRNCPAFVSRTGMAYGADGVIGTNLFSGFLVQIAYRDGVLHLNPMPSVNSLFNSPFFVRARKAGTQLYIPVEVDPGVPNYYALYTLSSDAYFESKSVPKTGKRYWNDLRAGSTGSPSGSCRRSILKWMIWRKDWGS
jgi:tetratricopeptide (TPR) repeat protein